MRNDGRNVPVAAMCQFLVYDTISNLKYSKHTVHQSGALPLLLPHWLLSPAHGIYERIGLLAVYC